MGFDEDNDDDNSSNNNNSSDNVNIHFLATATTATPPTHQSKNNQTTKKWLIEYNEAKCKAVLLQENLNLILTKYGKLFALKIEFKLNLIDIISFARSKQVKSTLHTDLFLSPCDR